MAAGFSKERLSVMRRVGVFLLVWAGVTLFLSYLGLKSTNSRKEARDVVSGAWFVGFIIALGVALL